MGGTVSEDEVKRYCEQVQIYTTNAMVERIRELEAEVERMRPVVEACRIAKRNGLIGPSSGFTVSQIYHAVAAYEASQRK